ncbi:uncharacterized protein TNIN_295291 [Trichonephila inaurata madagascariensis]|uniref:Peptidase aspartic putative domain-containing protein n=1 Tax=Trichonephila inaurata madagascariensis TaxID=2747483 RepID=A0A8X7CFD1_9ARAC|nr:uncharacterized protein TNIN_295291 [Trichonephila inaurata madagascariensis]
MRAAFSLSPKKIETELMKENIDMNQLSILKTQIMDKFQRLDTCQNHLSQQLLDSEDAVQEYLDDMEDAENYRVTATSKCVPGRCLKSFSKFKALFISKFEMENIHRRPSGNGEIGLLIGADNVGKLLTGNLIKLNSGLTAIETKLGWTVIGKLSPNVKNAMLTTSSLYVRNLSVKELWERCFRGIRDPLLNENMKENFDLTDFKNKMKILPDGRYEVKNSHGNVTLRICPVTKN